MIRMPAILSTLVFTLSAAAADVALRATVIPEAQRWSRWADFNGDGLDDLLYRNELRFNLGGRLAAPIALPFLTASASVSPGAIADFNGDGKADLILRGGDGVADRLVLGDGTGNFREVPLPSQYGNVEKAGDFSGDGIDDLVTYRHGGPLTLLRSNGDGTFAVQQQLAWTQETLERSVMQIGDVTGDAIPDIVLPFRTWLYFFYGNAHGTFSEPRVRFTRSSVWSLTIGDASADARPDLAFLHAFDETPAVVLLGGDGEGRFPDAARYRIEQETNGLASSEPVSVVIGDFVPGGGNEIATGAHNGVVRILAMRDGALREVASVQLDRSKHLANAHVHRVSFRAPGGRDLVVHIDAHEGNRVTPLVSLIEVDGALSDPSPRGRTRAAGRVPRTPNVSGTYAVRAESTCALPLSQLTLVREGMFVDAVQNDIVRSSHAVFVDGSLWMSITIADGSATRLLRGMFRPSASGFTGTFFEPGPTPCGGSQRHSTTIERQAH